MPHRENVVEIAEIGFVVFPVGSSCQGFLNNCFVLQFAVPKNVPSVEAHILFGGLEEFGNFELREPNCLPGHLQIEPRASVVRCVENEPAHVRVTLSITDVEMSLINKFSERVAFLRGLFRS